MGKYRLLAYSCMAFAFAAPVQAKVVTPSQAKALAAKYISVGAQLKTFKAPGAAQAAAPDFYAFNDSHGRGFVLIAGDDCLKPVLGYSRTGRIDTDNLPPAMKAWLDGIAQQIAKARAAGGGIAAAADDTDTGDDGAPTEVVAPLMKTKWYQLAPYYDNTPTVSGEQTLTGCVATAMAQVMKYYRWPQHGYGSVSYDTPKYDSKTLSANFEQSTYDWDNMLDTYEYSTDGDLKTPMWNDVQGKAVAQLMADLGAAVHMQYGTQNQDGSGAYDPDIATAATYHFGYDVDLQYKNNYTMAQWTKKIESCLDAGDPLVYCGIALTDMGGAGHCFVVDGYDSSNYMHVNWGWAGDADGYYSFYNFGEIGSQFSHEMMYARLTPNKSGTVTKAAQAPLGMLYQYSSVNQTGTKDIKHENKSLTADVDKLDADIELALYYKSWDKFEGNLYVDAVAEDGTTTKRLHEYAGVATDKMQLVQHVSLGSSDISSLPDGTYIINISSQRTNDTEAGSADVPVCSMANDALYVLKLVKQDGKATVGFVNTHTPLLTQIGKLEFDKDEYDITDFASLKVSLANNTEQDSQQKLYLKIVGADNKTAYVALSDIPMYAGDSGTLTKQVEISGVGGFKPGTYQVSLLQVHNGKATDLEGAQPVTLKINRNDSKLPVLELADIQVLCNDEPLQSLDNMVFDAEDFLDIICQVRTVRPQYTPEVIDMHYETGLKLDYMAFADFNQLTNENPPKDLFESSTAVFFNDDLVGKTGIIYAAYIPMFDTELHFMQYNGKDAVFEFKLVDDKTGISSVNGSGKAVETMRFDTEGRRVTAPVKGLNIIKMSDGTVRKVMVK